MSIAKYLRKNCEIQTIFSNFASELVITLTKQYYS